MLKATSPTNRCVTTKRPFRDREPLCGCGRRGDSRGAGAALCAGGAVEEDPEEGAAASFGGDLAARMDEECMGDVMPSQERRSEPFQMAVGNAAGPSSHLRRTRMRPSWLRDAAVEL